MTVLDHFPRRTDWQPRLHRRHEIVTTGGMAGVLRVGAALTTCGYQVHEFVADVQDGHRRLQEGSGGKQDPSQISGKCAAVDWTARRVGTWLSRRARLREECSLHALSDRSRPGCSV